MQIENEWNINKWMNRALNKMHSGLQRREISDFRINNYTSYYQLNTVYRS